jgi:hypothetical protein
MSNETLRRLGLAQEDLAVDDATRIRAIFHCSPSCVLDSRRSTFAARVSKPRNALQRARGTGRGWAQVFGKPRRGVFGERVPGVVIAPRLRALVASQRTPV